MIEFALFQNTNNVMVIIRLWKECSSMKNHLTVIVVHGVTTLDMKFPGKWYKSRITCPIHESGHYRWLYKRSIRYFHSSIVFFSNNIDSLNFIIIILYDTVQCLKCFNLNLVLSALHIFGISIFLITEETILAGQVTCPRSNKE